ncbi:MAG: hypothetical protein NVSMB68_10570 [Thermoanaerobaculia bacterium]
MAAFFVSQMLAVGLIAQSAEFGRVSDGSIDLVTKHSRPLSGSLSIAAGSTKGFDAGLGGTLVRDRVWFFATVEKSQPLFASRYATPIASNAWSRAIDTKTIAQLGDRANLAASFASSRQSALPAGANFGSAIPSSFLSLRYTGIVSNNMFVTANFSELRRTTAGY